MNLTKAQWKTLEVLTTAKNKEKLVGVSGNKVDAEYFTIPRKTVELLHDKGLAKFDNRSFFHLVPSTMGYKQVFVSSGRVEITQKGIEILENRGANQ